VQKIDFGLFYPYRRPPEDVVKVDEGLSCIDPLRVGECREDDENGQNFQHFENFFWSISRRNVERRADPVFL
jgi:hypothetical protein